MLSCRLESINVSLRDGPFHVVVCFKSVSACEPIKRDNATIISLFYYLRKQLQITVKINSTTTANNNKTISII